MPQHYLTRPRGADLAAPVASSGRTVADVLLGLLTFSYVNVDPNWTPTLGDGTFSMRDVSAFVRS